LLLGAVLVAFLAVLGAFIWPVTDLIAAHDVGAITGAPRAMQLQQAREAVRTQLLTLGAGLFAVGALWFTARNFILSREGQVTGRYTAAIEQLGSEKLDVRIGGIYALERVARDSARDHPAVMEVLAAFIREHSCEGSPRPDVRAALSVITRRISAWDRQPVDLTGAKLVSVDIDGMDFDSAILNRVVLNEAGLQGAKLGKARLVSADLSCANLRDADLSGANLFDADLGAATLTNAKLNGAKLELAKLGYASLIGADLTGADLMGADFTEADISDADLTGAKWLPRAEAPKG
jgi:uncharacterized protein YjbI with pentapeptide repeats